MMLSCSATSLNLFVFSYVSLSLTSDHTNEVDHRGISLWKCLVQSTIISLEWVVGPVNQIVGVILQKTADIPQIRIILLQPNFLEISTKRIELCCILLLVEHTLETILKTILSIIIPSSSSEYLILSPALHPPRA